MRVHSAIVLAVVLLGASSAWPRDVQAEALALGFSAPAGCPGEPHVRARVLELLADSDTSALAIRAQGKVRPRGRTHVLELRIELSGHAVSRKLEADDCSVLADTAAWLIAVAVDPNVKPPTEAAAHAAKRPEANPYDGPAPAIQPAPPEAEPEPAPRAEAAAPASEGKPTSERESARESAPLHVGVGADLQAGVWVAGLAGPMATLVGRAGVLLDRFTLALRFSHRFARSESLAVEGGRVEFVADGLALLGCAAFGQKLRAGPCVGLDGQRLHGSTSGISTPAETTRYWLGVELGGELRWALLSDLDLVLGAGVGLPVTARPVFQVTGVGVVGEVNFVSGFANLGVGARFR